MSIQYPPDNRYGANDNMSWWTKQYPELLRKNFIGIARIWDMNNPPTTFTIMPFRNMPFHFKWKVYINPAIIAPKVQEGAETPLSDSEMKLETFVCEEYRIGDKISERAIDFGVGNIVQTSVKNLVNAVNTAREWKNILALTGTNPNQPLALSRLQSFEAGTSKGGSATTWEDYENSDPIQDLLSAKKLITKRTGMMATDAFLPINEYDTILNHPKILEQLKYTNSNLLNRGEIPTIKGLRLHQVASFFKNRKKDGTDEKIYMLEDKVVVTAGNVGFTGVAEPKGGSAPIIDRWYKKSQRSIFVHAFSSFVPVIEDYGRICIIENTDGTIGS